MRKLLVRLFVRNSENVKDSAVRENYGRLASWVGIAVNAVLCTLKILAGIFFHSVSILADGINNLADSSASLITLIGFKLAGKKPDKDHPYGYGRTEYLTGLAVSVMIVVIGVQLFRTSLDKTLHPQELEFSMLSVVLLCSAILVKLWLAGFNNAIGKKIDSDTLKATAADSRNDVISTSAVLVCVLLGRFFSINLDGPVGILVALFIFWSGIGLVKETIAPILGQTPDPAMVQALTDEVMAHEGVLGVHDLIIHDYGPGRIFASVHAEVDASVDVMVSHDLMDVIEVDVYKKLNMLLTVHMDPLQLKSEVVALARERITEVIGGLDYVQSFHDLRVVEGPTHTNVIFDVVVDFGCKLSASEVRSQITKGLQQFEPAYLTVIQIDRAYS